MIDQAFSVLGFKEEETKVYLSLLDRGASAAGELAKFTGLPRPTLYGYLEKLMAGGLVSQSMKRGVKIFIAEPADKIRLLYKRKIEELRAREKALDFIVPELEKRAGLNMLRPRMQFFEGRAGIESALNDVLNAAPKSMTLSFWPIRAMIEATSPEFFHYLNAERIRRNIHIEAIWPRAEGVDIRRHPYMGSGAAFKREIRIAPEGVEFKMGYWIYGDKIIFISSRAESYGFIIESAELRQMMAAQHQIVWKISEPVQFDPKHVKAFLDEIKD